MKYNLLISIIFTVVSFDLTAKTYISFDYKEISIRLATERLTENQKIEILNEPLKSLNNKAQMEYYAHIFNSMEMGYLQLSLRIQESLVISAMEKIMTLDDKVFQLDQKSTFTLESLVRTLTDWAATHQNESPTISYHYFTQFFSIPMLNNNMLEDMIYFFSFWSSNKLKYPHYEFVMKNIIASSLFDKDKTAGKIVDSIDSKHVWTSSGSSLSKTFQPSYAARARVLQYLIDSNKIRDVNKPFVSDLTKKFFLSAEFLKTIKKMSTDNRDLISSKEKVLQMLKVKGLAPYLIEVTTTWLLHNSLSHSIQDEIILSLIENSEKAIDESLISSPEFVIKALNEMHYALFYLNFSENVQKELVHFIIRHTNSAKKETESLRFSLVYQYLLEGKVYLSTQWALETLIDNALPIIDKSADNYNKNSNIQDINSWMEMILEAVETCTDLNKEIVSAGFDRKICTAISNHKKLLLKIINNNNISYAFRDRAQKIKVKFINE